MKKEQSTGRGSGRNHDQDHLFVRWGRHSAGLYIDEDRALPASDDFAAAENFQKTDDISETENGPETESFSETGNGPGTGDHSEAESFSETENFSGTESFSGTKADRPAAREKAAPGSASGSGPRAILAGCNTGLSPDRYARMISELRGLAKACGLEPAGTIVQNTDHGTHATYLGSGKVVELRREVEARDADIVLFNEALTPMQMRNLEKELDTEVLDRTGLILQIFASRARTREAKLQVESAQLQYMLPRLVGMRASLSRQGGGSGRLSNKGAGEQKLELDRRRIEKRLAELRRDLEVVDRERATQRSRRLRTGLTRGALVGYTNAGKSTIMNALLDYSSTAGKSGGLQLSDPDFLKKAPAPDYVEAEDKRVFQANMLFATLDTSVRRIDAPGHLPFLLADTVGFVQDLPHALVKAFRSTLEEVRYADLLLEVVDFSDPEYRDQIEVTAKTLEEIGAGHIPVVYLYNKTDLAMAQAGAGTSETAVFTRVEAGRSGTAAFTQDRSGTAAFTRDASGTATAARSASGKSRPVPDSIPFRRGEVLYLAAGRGVGIPDILTLIDDSLSQGRSEAEFLIPYHRGAVLQEIRSCGVLLAEDYQADGIHVRARCRREDIRRLQRMLGES